jgi:hypothetical protein
MEKDMSNGFIWVVQQKFKGMPVLMSVHTDRHYAWEAVLEYMDDTQELSNFCVHPIKLNQHFVSPLYYPEGKPLTTQGE